MILTFTIAMSIKYHKTDDGLVSTDAYDPWWFSVTGIKVIRFESLATRGCRTKGGLSYFFLPLSLLSPWRFGWFCCFFFFTVHYQEKEVISFALHIPLWGPKLFLVLLIFQEYYFFTSHSLRLLCRIIWDLPDIFASCSYFTDVIFCICSLAPDFTFMVGISSTLVWETCG